ncbi:MFS transporter [Tianweitania sediminis]|uniref:MFS transporter n=1 Tax=Tianweitania sediminis TaxID=1502156 RepID=A0A8J7R8P7_9HYPH|nr:MFS transporter [Tianweitania sediminis]MBP0440277.1 MFS transporter [Tianweitania sediminis]
MVGLVAFALGYMLSQFYRTFLAVLTPALTAELGATKAQLSLASGAWFVAFALMQFAVGVWLDRYGPRRTTSLLLAAGGGSGAAVFATANSPEMIIVAMALIGIGCSAALMGAVYVFSKSYPPAKLALLTSMMVGIGSLGNVVGASPLANAAEMFGWREVMAGLGVFTLFAAGAVFLLVRDPEPTHIGHASGAGFRGYIELLKIPALWAIIPLTAVNYGPVVNVRSLWAGTYLTDLYGADALTIGRVTLFMALAMVAGNFLYGPLDTLLRTRKWIAVGGNLISLVVVVILASQPVTSIATVTLLFIAMGLAGASYGLLMAHARAFYPPHLVGRGSTLMNFFSIGGVGAMQFASGAVVTAATVPGEPSAAYSALFWFYALLLALAVLIYLWSTDAKPDRP